MKRIFAFGLALAAISVAIAGEVAPRHDRDMGVAIKVLGSSLVQSVQGAPEDSFRGPASELALAFIASGKDQVSMRSFASLMAYRIDGGLSEDFHCYALGADKAFDKVLANINVEALVGACRDNIRSVAVPGKMSLDDLPMKICQSAIQVKQSISELRQARVKSEKCSPEDF